MVQRLTDQPLDAISDQIRHIERRQTGERSHTAACHADRTRFEHMLNHLATSNPQALADLMEETGSIRVRIRDGAIIGYSSRLPPYYFNGDSNLTAMIGRVANARESRCVHSGR